MTMSAPTKQSNPDQSQARLRAMLKRTIKVDFDGSVPRCARALGLTEANLYRIARDPGAGITPKTEKALTTWVDAQERRKAFVQARTTTKQKEQTAMTMHSEETNGTTKTEAKEAPALSYDPKTVFLEEWRGTEIKCAALREIDIWEHVTQAGAVAASEPILTHLTETEYRHAARSYCHQVNAHRFRELAKEEKDQHEATSQTLVYELRRRHPAKRGTCATPDLLTGVVRGCNHDDDEKTEQNPIEVILSRIGAR